MEVGRIQPNDVEAEQAVLGSMLLDKDAVTNAIEILKSEDFYREENKLIFSAMVSLYARSEPIDIITVKDELVSLGKLDVCGGIEFLAELSDKVPTTANVDNYIKIVEEKAVLRSLIKTSNELIDLGYDQTYTAEEIVEKAEKSIFDLSKNRNKKGFAHIKEVLFETFEQIEKLDYLINNAGTNIDSYIETFKIEDFRKVLDVNLVGKVICTKHAIPLLKNSKTPSIVNIASRLGTRPCMEASAYCSAEAGIINFTRSKCTRTFKI